MTENTSANDVQSCQTAVIASADVQEITFKMVFSVPDGYSCFTEKSQEKFTEKIKEQFDLIESGIGFGCFGIKIEVDKIEKIEVQKTVINEFALSILKLEKIKKPKPVKPPYATYSTIFKIRDRVTLEQVNYTDNRMFQNLNLRDYACSRSICDKLKQNIEAMKSINGFSIYGFGSHLSINFKQGIKFTEIEINDFIKKYDL